MFRRVRGGRRGEERRRAPASDLGSLRGIWWSNLKVKGHWNRTTLSTRTKESSTVDDRVGPAAASGQQHPTRERLEDQIGWYDQRSRAAQRRYKVLKFAQVIIAALIPLTSAFPIPTADIRWLVALLGLLVLIIEAIQQLNQDQQNWITYRSTCEALKHEKYLYLAGAGPYASAEIAERRLALLADRIEGLISQEHAKWLSAQEQAETGDRDTATHATRG